MRTWNDWSDYEINKKIGVLRGLKVASSYECIITGACYLLTDTYGKIIPYNPCNSWNDAGGIIVANRIMITPYQDESQGWFSTTDSSFFVDDNNPLRAAMIVFLMMSGVEENGE